MARGDDAFENPALKKLPKDVAKRIVADAQKWADTIAKSAAESVRTRLTESLATELAGGGTLEKWLEKVQTGVIELQLPSRVETLVRTNLQLQYGEGRYRQQQENKALRPYLMYDAIGDDRTRANHQAMDGFIGKADSAWWRQRVPPCGYQCRCRAIALTEAQAKRRGLGMSPPRAQADEGFRYDRSGPWPPAV